MNPKKVIVCDLDGTLAASKSPLAEDMAEVLGHVLKRYMIAVVSGGAYSQFEKQFLSQLHIDKILLKNLYLFPTNGAACYIYDSINGKWKQEYNEPIPEKDKKAILKAANSVVKEFELDKAKTYGDIVEDRGSQVTISGLGQAAPLSAKEKWDPNQAKRTKMIEALKKEIPNFEIRMGGTTSIDITKKGLDKAYSIAKIKNLLKVKDEDIIYVGDALYKGGNDEAVKNTGVDFIQEDGPDNTLEFLSRFM
jgi:HAD superfamily hydrolase (TIGR01484 family)